MSTAAENRLPRLLRAATVLIILGLIVEIVSLAWFHPLAFVLFGFVSAPLVGIGILMYLLSLLFLGTPAAANRG